ncbi:MAG TPA: hypothetical protein VF173_15850 [Thermoanaerobaculia bacterium]|nr:hypothetical protein [Thermoanaerobaculia bacterium]
MDRTGTPPQGPLSQEAYFWNTWSIGKIWIDIGFTPADPENPRRRPSFLALKTLIRELDGARLEEVLPEPPPARLYRFRRQDGSEVVVGWSAGGRRRRFSLGPRFR